MAELDLKQRREDRRALESEVNFVRVGNYLAEVDVAFIYNDHEWSPYLSIENVRKLEDVQRALKRGDLVAAGRRARVYQLTPVTVDSVCRS